MDALQVHSQKHCVNYPPKKIEERRVAFVTGQVITIDGGKDGRLSRLTNAGSVRL
jgi:hypothetical protein